ncbi:Glutaredoxin-related protein 5, mitochondrial [Eumeta japonica]|uniref:Glutaredoxin-related protein 5, mitochondrial n=1 Tax=Eumeta variegata TaxID=151549 RepID=A0A4C1WBD7_EUMVA|nr:Glutaredoxin-related protein 5, mitochondrial [Eumeta japonica]
MLWPTWLQHKDGPARPPDPSPLNILFSPKRLVMHWYSSRFQVSIGGSNHLLSDGLPACVKEYTNWPTIPQVFIGGEFVGGCDIMLQMHQSGELIEELKKIGIKSALLAEDSKKETDK